MASITAGNELYLYVLFMKNIGAGRQVMLTRIEEVLLEDDIMPCDLGCKDVREVLENLSSFVRLTVFKKGRVYATIVADPAWDEVLARAKKAPEPQVKDKGGAKSWKRKRTKRDPKPAKPRPRNRPKPTETPAQASDVTEIAEPLDSAQNGQQPPVTEPHEDAPAPRDQPEVVRAPEPNEPAEPAFHNATAPEPPSEPKQEPPAEPKAAAPDATAPEDAEESTQEQAPDKDAEPAPVVVHELPHITLTVTYDPSDDLEQDFEEEEPVPAPIPQATPSPTSQLRYPENFSSEVTLRNEELSALYQMLPLDVDPLVLLEEDWRVAHSTHDFTQHNGVVTFPLRYLKEPGGDCVHVSMRRTRERGTSKRWAICALDHVENVGFEGLPVTGTDVMRELAQFALLGPWEDLVERLERTLEGASPVPKRDELSAYLCVTFHRIQCEHKFCVYDDGAHGAFDTGLLNGHNQRVLMCFDAQQGTVGWQFSDFCTAEDKVFDGAAPLPASYLSTLSDILIDPQTPVQVDKRLMRTYGAPLEDALCHALRRARRDYRLCTPAYDPLANELRLLIPVYLEDKAYALVLHPHEQGNGYVAHALLPREQAAAHARVISFELPRWLC